MQAQPPSATAPLPIASRRAAARAPVRTALRNATGAAHERMHRLGPFRAIFEEALAAERYLPLLRSLFRFHSAIGAAAARCGWSSLSSAAGRLDLLRSDICCLGGEAPSPTRDWRPSSREAALGGLYAAEGSMVGGRVIAGQLDYIFGAAPDGRSFFIGSPGDRARWRTLLAALEEHCTTAGAVDRAIGGALFAFDLFEQCVLFAEQESCVESSYAEI